MGKLITLIILQKQSNTEQMNSPLLLYTSIIATIMGFGTAPFIPLGILFKIRLYKIQGPTLKYFVNKVKHSAVTTNDIPEGFIMGKWYIGYVHDEYSAYVCCTESYYAECIIQKPYAKIDPLSENTNANLPTRISYYIRFGTYEHLMYYSRALNLPTKPIKEHQSKAIQQIMEIYEKNKYCVCLLSGNPGTMKSRTAEYLCKHLMHECGSTNVNFTDSFNPFEPGNSFETLYYKACPSLNNQIVVVLEEIDVPLTKIHHGIAHIHKNITTEVCNKTDWNRFLDKFDRELYPYVVLIMTTNKSFEYFDELDPSYMREGRVNLKIKY